MYSFILTFLRTLAPCFGPIVQPPIWRVFPLVKICCEGEKYKGRLKTPQMGGNHRKIGSNLVPRPQNVEWGEHILQKMYFYSVSHDPKGLCPLHIDIVPRR